MGETDRIRNEKLRFQILLTSANSLRAKQGQTTWRKMSRKEIYLGFEKGGEPDEFLCTPMAKIKQPLPPTSAAGIQIPVHAMQVTIPR